MLKVVLILLLLEEKENSVWEIRARFIIELNQRDLSLLKKIQNFFGGIGRIYQNKAKNSFNYRVTKITDFKTILIPHFEKYKLLTQKGADFI